jgi:hypothetical protein
MSLKRVFLLIALPSVVLLAALAYFGYELSVTRKENRELLQQLLQVRQQVGGSGEGQEAYLKGAVKNTIVKHSQSIQGCYLTLIESTPELPDSGKVMADWQIDSEGKVFEAGVVRDEFSSKEFKACLREKIGEIIFPAPPSVRPVYVEHTFVFKKEENN